MRDFVCVCERERDCGLMGVFCELNICARGLESLPLSVHTPSG